MLLIKKVGEIIKKRQIMLRIRFFRKGRKGQPFYKIVVTDKNNPPASGRFVEEVGFYNPHTKECEISKEKVVNWMGKGAQPSDVVHNLLVKKGIIEGKKINVVSLSKKRKEKLDEKKEKEESSKATVAQEMQEVVKEEAKEEEAKKEAEETVKKEEPVKEEDIKEEKTEEPAKEEEEKK